METQNNTEVVENNLKENLKARFDKAKNSLEILTASMNRNVEIINESRARVLNLREKNPETTSQDVKDDIMLVHQANFDIQLKQIEHQRLSAIFVEYYEICALNAIDMELEESDKVEIEKLIEASRSIFNIDIDKNQVSIVDLEQYEKTYVSLRERAESPEAIEAAFNSPMFTVQPKK
jgi:hypothetical protein